VSEVRHIVVTGLMGAGKSTVGHALAERLGWRFSDSDTEISARSGLTVRELHQRDGVSAMHDAEARHLDEALRSPEHSVICAAASVIDRPACRVAMQADGVLTIWLRGSPVTLAERFQSETHRPVFEGSPATFLATQAAARDARYRKTASLIVDVDGRTPSEVIACAVRLLGDHGVVCSTDGSESRRRRQQPA
jgi:shikimate kinase